VPWWSEGRTRIYLLGEAEVDELNVALGVDENVLRLQVAIGDALRLVKVFEDEDDFGGIEAGGGFVEAPLAAEVAEDFAAGAIVELRWSGVGHRGE
jgi:hypothetical protein